MAESDRLSRLQAALEIAQRHGNPFLEANIKRAIREHTAETGEAPKPRP